MLLPDRRGLVAVIVVLLGSSMAGCAQRARSNSPKPAVAVRPGQADKPTTQAKGSRAQANIDRSQEKIDEVRNRLKSGARASSAAAASGSALPPATQTQQPMDTNGRHLPPYGVVILTQPTPAADNGITAVPSEALAAPESPVGLVRGVRRLGSRAATVIFVAVMAAIVGVPLLRRRSQLTRSQGT
jgi:hypothetical protein